MAGLKRPCAALAGLVFSGCLYSTHHFHTGALLKAGKSQTTLGLGRQPLWTCSRPDTDTVAIGACNEDGMGAESVSVAHVPKVSVNYRLGIRDQWGPFPGAELEWHLEAPTNPATMEFALSLALPAGDSFRHKIGAGWGIGAWADNSLFSEYAISKRFGIPLLFGSFRITWLATQIGDVLGEDFSKPFPNNQHLVFQTAWGARFQLPPWPVMPDFLIPQFVVTIPQVPSGEQEFRVEDIPLAQWDINLGLGWGF